MSVLVRPPVTDLVFQLYSKPLHPELFDILACRKVQREDYEINVRITRSGHFITWETASGILSEVVGDVNALLAETPKLVRHRLAGEQTAAVSLSNGLRYQASFQVETLAPEVFLHIHDEIIADAAKGGLLHNFHPSNRLATSPLGYVSVQAKPGLLLWSTFHTFPEENAVLKTQSLIE